MPSLFVPNGQEMLINLSLPLIEIGNQCFF